MLPLDDSGAVGQASFIQRYDIIATVLDLIQAAWIKVCQKPEINTQSDEDTIAGALHNEMWAEKCDLNDNLAKRSRNTSEALRTRYTSYLRHEL